MATRPATHPVPASEYEGRGTGAGWPLVLVLLALAATPLQADPTVSTYSFTPDYSVYGQGVGIEVRMRVAGNQPQGYTLVLQSEAVLRDWDVFVDLGHLKGTGTPQEVPVPAQAALITVSLNASAPPLVTPALKDLFRADWRDSAGVLHELKVERRQVGPTSVAPTPAPTPTPTPAPTPAPTPTPAPRIGTLKVVVEPPGLAAPIFVDGKFGGNGTYEVTGLAPGNYLVSFGEVAGYEKPASQAVSLAESRPSVLVSAQYRAVATPPPSPPPTPTPATPSPAPPPPPGPGLPIAVAAGAVVVLLVIALALKKRKAGPPPPPPEVPAAGAPPPEPPPSEAAPPPPEPSADVTSSDISADALREKKAKIEKRIARLEEEKEKGEVTAEGPDGYEERKKKYQRELEEIDKEIQKRGS